MALAENTDAGMQNEIKLGDSVSGLRRSAAGFLPNAVFSNFAHISGAWGYALAAGKGGLSQAHLLDAAG